MLLFCNKISAPTKQRSSDTKTKHTFSNPHFDISIDKRIATQHSYTRLQPKLSNERRWFLWSYTTPQPLTMPSYFISTNLTSCRAIKSSATVTSSGFTKVNYTKNITDRIKYDISGRLLSQMNSVGCWTGSLSYLGSYALVQSVSSNCSCRRQTWDVRKN